MTFIIDKSNRPDTEILFSTSGLLESTNDLTWDGISLQVGDAKAFVLGADDDLTIVHSGTAGSITNITGDLTVSSSSGNVQVESVVFASGVMTGVDALTATNAITGGSLVTGTLTVDDNSITQGSGDLTLSAGGNTIVESVTFNVGAITGVSTLTASGTITSGSLTLSDNTITQGTGDLTLSAGGNTLIDTTTGNISVGAEQTTGVLNIGTSASRTSDINIGNAANTGVINVSTTGTMNMGTTSTGELNLFTNATNTNAISIGNSSRAGAINILTGGTLNLGTGMTTGDINLHNASQTGKVIVKGTTESTSVSTGALVVDGGVGIAKDVIVGGDIETTSISFDSGTNTLGNFVDTSTFTVTFTDSADNEFDGTVTEGLYNRIGNVVYVVIRCSWTQRGSSPVAGNDVKIGGLPFTPLVSGTIDWNFSMGVNKGFNITNNSINLVPYTVGTDIFIAKTFFDGSVFNNFTVSNILGGGVPGYMSINGFYFI